MISQLLKGLQKCRYVYLQSERAQDIWFSLMISAIKKQIFREKLTAKFILSASLLCERCPSKLLLSLQMIDHLKKF